MIRNGGKIVGVGVNVSVIVGGPLVNVHVKVGVGVDVGEYLALCVVSAASSMGSVWPQISCHLQS